MERQAKILAVDDSSENLRLLQALLNVAGYEVVTASNGEEALVKVAKESPDLIIIDAMMPKLNGFEVCALLKSEEETRLIPVVLTTPIEELEYKIRGFEAGADDFLHRPSIRLLRKPGKGDRIFAVGAASAAEGSDSP
jgi:PleD family two-component response regulator